MTLVPDSIPIPSNQRYSAAVHELDDVIYRLIAARRAPSSTREDNLLGLLLAARDLSDREVRDEIITVMSAAYDTTALALAWACVLLEASPIAKAQLYTAVDSALCGRLPGLADMTRLSYVQKVVTETLRLYPSAWVIRREAVCDTQIGGQRVRKGTNVLISPWVVQRDPRFFAEPLEFRPDRWSDGLATSLPRCAYMPFGAGQRTCIGSGFALTEAVVLLSLIVARFRVEVVESSRRVKPVPVLTLQPSEQILVRLAGR